MTYAEKLKDPRWQKKRLEVLEDREWRCELCKETEKTLHVHHSEYNGEPWEATNNKLFVLCEDCHENSHKCDMDVPKYIDFRSNSMKYLENYEDLCIYQSIVFATNASLFFLAKKHGILYSYSDVLFSAYYGHKRYIEEIRK